MGKHSKKQNSKKTHGFQKIPLHVKNTLNPLVQNLLNRCSSINTPKKLEWEHYKEIYALLQEICDIEKDYVLPLPKREENWDKFNSWCLQHGAVCNGVQISAIEDGSYGMFAEKDFKEDDLLLAVPRKLMLSTSAAQQSKLGPLIAKDPILQHMPNVVLSLFLLSELVDKNSFWQPYLSILPSIYDTILYFNLEEIQQLQGSSTQEEVLTICRSVARQYAYFQQLFQSDSYARTLDISHHFTYDLYRWAVSTVMTRQNAVPSPDGNSQYSALIPLWDMFNHKNGKFSSEFDLEKDSLVSLAMQNYNQGEEVFIFYGPRTNAKFFVHNGFVYPQNCHDAVNIRFGLSKSDPLFLLKSQLCEKQELPVNGTFQLHPENFDDKLMAFLKINVMKEDELKMELSESVCNGAGAQDVDVQNRVFTFLKTRISLLLNTYKVPNEVDSLPHLLMISELCSAEKGILKRAYDYCCQNSC